MYIEYKQIDINDDVFEFKWTDYGHNDDEVKTIYGSLIGKFKIGQGVIVINDMTLYSNYTPMIIAMGFLKENMRRKLYNGECGVIVGRKYHESKKKILYGVRMNDYKIALVDEIGLKINEKYIELLDDKLFEI